MKISSVDILPFSATCASFKGRYLYLQPDDTINQEQLNNEGKQTKRAKKFGVDVPLYASKKGENGNISWIQYETKGDIADLRTNPVSKKHLRNLFKNLFILDKTGIYHNDLDSAHLFFADDGGVEIDCFRYSFNFAKKPNGKLIGNNGSIRIPDFIMPSNEMVLEEQFLGGYISKMKNDSEKEIFMKNYLKERSYYHQKRAKMLLDRGFVPDDKTVKFEEIQSRVFKDPSKDIIEFSIEKAELLGKKRAAYTEWDEGNGACGHEINPVRRFNAIIMHIDCIKDAMKLNEKSKNLAKNAQTDDEQAFFKLENQADELFLKNLYDDTKGMARWNFVDDIEKIYLADKDEMDDFLDLYSEIDINKPAEAMLENIEKSKEYYKDLIFNWQLVCESDWIEEHKKNIE